MQSQNVTRLIIQAYLSLFYFILALPVLSSGIFKSLWVQLFIIGMDAFIYIYFC
jgi:hypothetical protein